MFMIGNVHPSFDYIPTRGLRANALKIIYKQPNNNFSLVLLENRASMWLLGHFAKLEEPQIECKNSMSVWLHAAYRVCPLLYAGF